MTTYAIDDAEFIRRRLEEIEAEKNLALTGSTVEEPKEQPRDDYYGMYVSGYAEASNKWQGLPSQKANALNPYNTGYGSLNGSLSGGLLLSSLAHADWPYAGTGFEWRKFVRS